MSSATMNADRYRKLLSDCLPVVIETEDENERFLRGVRKLSSKGSRMTPEEKHLLGLMVLLIEDYEGKKYAMKAASPNEVLRELMRARGVRQKDLLGVFGSRGIASEVVRGKRRISKAHARALSEFFHVSPALFL